VAITPHSPDAAAQQNTIGAFVLHTPCPNDILHKKYGMHELPNGGKVRAGKTGLNLHMVEPGKVEVFEPVSAEQVQYLNWRLYAPDWN
jgi:hypothetical protein